MCRRPSVRWPRVSQYSHKSQAIASPAAASAARSAVVQRGPEILVAGVQRVYPFQLAGAQRVTAGGQPCVEVPVTLAQGGRVPGLAQPPLPVLADGIQHAIPGRVPARASPQDGLRHQLVDQIHDLPGVHAITPAHRFGGVEVE